MAPPLPATSEFPPLETPAEPLLPHCPVPVEVPPEPQAHIAPQTVERSAGSDEPLDVHPVVEPTTAAQQPAQAQAPVATTTAPRALYASRRKREYASLFKHYRRMFNLLVLLFLFVGAGGWTARYHVLREVLLLKDGAELRLGLEAEMVPLLCETLSHDRSATRRRRAAQLLEDGPTLHAPDSWPFLLEALTDPDIKVESAARSSFGSAFDADEHEEIRKWVSHLPAVDCIEVIRCARSPQIARGFLDLLKTLRADAYWLAARWAVGSVPDPQMADVVLQDVRLALYDSTQRHPIADHPIEGCLLAGLANSDIRIRDRCRRLVLDYAYDRVTKDDLIEWMRSIRDFDTWQRTVYFAQRDAPDDWRDALKARMAAETDYDFALRAGCALHEFVGDAREAEFLRAGLENTDPEIHECFDALLNGAERANFPPVEPDDGR